MGRPGSLLKAVTDIVFAGLALILVSPILAISAVAIKLTSPGPVFFTQTRVGLGEKPFRIYKLRTMVKDAERAGPALTQRGDPRVTRLGRFLRRASVDELPQLLNVLRGDMSLVGPRPEVPSEASRYPVELREVFQFKPGITGISQISGRAALPTQQKVRMEIDYGRRAGFWSDLLIVLKTPLALITGKGNVM